MHLRDAAETVGILHVLFGTGDEFAPLQNLHETLCSRHLPFVTTELVRERIEGLDAAVEGVERKGADNVGPLRKTVGLYQRVNGMRAHELGAVQKGQTLLALKLDGLPAELRPNVGSRPRLPVIDHLSHADKRQAHVGQGRQVAGSAERTLTVDHRQHVGVEHVDEALNRDELGSGMAVG